MSRGPDAGVLRPRVIAILVVLVLATGGAVGWWVTRDDEPVPAVARGEPVRILPDPLTLVGGTAGARSVSAGATVEVDVIAADAVAGDAVLLNLEVSGAAGPGEVWAFPCSAGSSGAPRSGFEASGSSAQLLAPVGDDGRVCVEASADAQIEVEAIGRLAAPQFTAEVPSSRLLDTRAGGATFDGAFAGDGPVAAGATVELEVVGRDGVGAVRTGLVALNVETIGRDTSGTVTLRACDATTGPIVDVRANAATVRSLIVPVGSTGAVCADATEVADLVVDLTGVFEPSIGRSFADPVRIVDTRPTGSTFDSDFAGIGVRPESATLEVPLTDRIGVHEGLVAVVVNVAVDQPLDDGRMTVFPAGSRRDQLASLQYRAGESGATTTIVPVRPSGEICVATTGRTDVVVDLVGLLTLAPSTTTATVPAESGADLPGCPQQDLFPERRLVAMYGSNRTPRLGVLGEQDAEAAADRLAEIAEPWREGDRTVLPAFELIATLATADDGDDGVHRLRSSHDVVQGYLDVARRHGYYLILDIQPGWSDFLTEAMYYEPFLRQPDVGLALDPEWRTRPPDPPAGGYVGQTDADEINAVAEWLARIVAEEDLPEKLLVVHQFQERMVLDRDQVVEPPGIAVTFHMDGFGTRGQKQHTWSLLRVEAPWNNGLKLFYDEDIDRYRPDEILAGAFDPIPDLITYQ